jgi:hypothetical protein
VSYAQFLAGYSEKDNDTGKSQQAVFSSKSCAHCCLWSMLMLLDDIGKGGVVGWGGGRKSRQKESSGANSL